MTINVGVKKGINKLYCDDTVIVNYTLVYDDYFDWCLENLKTLGVADGVGGNSGGKEASYYIMSEIAHKIFEKKY